MREEKYNQWLNLILKEEALFEEQEICSLKITQNVIACRCKCTILWYLSRRSRRGNELQKLLLGVSNSVLKGQLRELEEDGMVRREVYELVPPKVVYS